ncbi:hypothetical protein OY671_012161, partial [Metschnikowia pulcherrima]
PRLPVSVNSCFGNDMEQRAGQHVEIERIGSGCRHQLAESSDLLRLERAGLVVQRAQLRVIVARLSHIFFLAAAKQKPQRSTIARERNRPAQEMRRSQSRERQRV